MRVHRQLHISNKNLSVNYIDSHRHLAKDDDGGCKVIERYEAACKLLVAHQQLAESVEPAVTDLDNPAPGLCARRSLLGFRLAAPAHDMRDVAVTFYRAEMFGPTVARVRT